MAHPPSTSARPRVGTLVLSTALLLGLGCDGGEGDPADGAAGPDGSFDAALELRDGDVAPTATELARETIGPDGGSILADGFVLTIPPGALTASTEIVLSTVSPAPSGFAPYSPVFRLEPHGLTFLVPATATIRFDGDANLASVFWSRANAAGFERLGGRVSGDEISTSIEHFSDGFAGDGVDFDDPGDIGCGVTTQILGGGPTPEDPVTPGAFSAVGAVVAVEDCVGRPIRDLTLDDFSLLEDGSPLSSESYGLTLIPSDVAVRGFATLVIDFSVSTQSIRSEIIAAAEEFVRQLHEVRELPVYIGVVVFAGDEEIDWWVEPTLDTDALRAGIADLESFDPLDPLATNLHGAVSFAVEETSVAARAFRTRNFGGAYAVGTVVVFSDGRDTAGFEGGGSGDVWVVPYVSEDYDEATVLGLAGRPENVFPLQDGEASGLPSHFAYVANRFAARIDGGTYVLAFCSASRAGTHALTVRVTEAVDHPDSSFGEMVFDAEGFGPGCTPDYFTEVCDDRSCGGFACGACDDRTSRCDGNACDDFCLVQDVCDGTTIENPLGYSQECASVAEHLSCSARCVDTRSDRYACGSCETACAGLDACIDGACVCSEGYADCNADPADGCETFLAGAASCDACGSGCCDVSDDACRMRAVELMLLEGDGVCVRYADGRLVCPHRQLPGGITGSVPREVEQVSRSCLRFEDGRVQCDVSTAASPTGTNLEFSNERYTEITSSIGLTTRGRVLCYYAEDECAAFSTHSDYVEVETGPVGSTPINCARREGGELSCNQCRYPVNSADDSTPITCEPVSAPFGSFSALAAGSRMMFGLTTGGAIVGFSGDGDRLDLGTGWVEVSAYDQVTCGRRADGTVRCFNFLGEEDPEAQPPAGVLFANIEGTCGIDLGGLVHCWSRDRPYRSILGGQLLPREGRDVIGMAGDDPVWLLLESGGVDRLTASGRVPAPGGPYTAIVGSGLALAADGEIVNLVPPPGGEVPEPILGTYIALAECGDQIGALSDAGAFSSPASGGTGEGGPFTSLYCTQPSDLPGLCARRPDNLLDCNGLGVDGFIGYSRIAYNNICRVTLAGTLSCTESDYFDPPPSGADFVDVAGSGPGFCARRSSGRVECWGNALSPVAPLPGEFREIQSTGGESHQFCGISIPDGRIRCALHSPPPKPGFVAFWRDHGDRPLGGHLCAFHETDGLHCWDDDGAPLYGFD